MYIRNILGAAVTVDHFFRKIQIWTGSFPVFYKIPSRRFRLVVIFNTPVVRVPTLDAHWAEPQGIDRHLQHLLQDLRPIASNLGKLPGNVENQSEPNDFDVQ